MPSVSDKQRRFMAAAANNPAFAKKADIPRSVAQEYHSADKKKPEFTFGGLTRATKPKTASFRDSIPNRGGVLQGQGLKGPLGQVNRRLAGTNRRLGALSREISG